MNLLKLFKKSPAAPVEVPVTVSDEPVAEPTRPSNIVTVVYGTGMPIDAVYAFLARNYEEEGYSDALASANADFCLAREKMILNELTQLFRRVNLRYNDLMHQADVQIANAEALFAIASLTQLRAHKEMCQEHIDELNTMMAKLQANDPEMLTMTQSYRRGFIRGTAARTTSFINPQAKEA